MAKPFRDLIKGFPPERLELISAEAEVLITEYEVLKALRMDCELTQEQLAAIMGVRQASISKIENQQDIRLTTLQKYAEALGGELEVRVNFPDRSVSVRQFTTGAEEESPKDATNR